CAPMCRVTQKSVSCGHPLAPPDASMPLPAAPLAPPDALLLLPAAPLAPPDASWLAFYDTPSYKMYTHPLIPHKQKTAADNSYFQVTANNQ
ncbi:hypothetical protein, partial [uncultured Duncaniella sp.]